MSRVDAATLVEDLGLVGNADRGGARQVTLVDADAWERATRELGREVDPSARRGNLLVRGVDLRESTGRVLCVGPARIRIRGETLPCDRMEDGAAGLRDALAPEWRAGVYGMVVEGGSVAVGDEVAWE